MTILTLDGIHRSYHKGIPVLRGIDLSIQPGEVVGLLGRNGAGKTTLIRTVMGMLRPQQGQVRVFGLDPFADPLAVKRRTGYVSEDQVLAPSASAGEVIAFHKQLFPSWDEDFENQLTEQFEIDKRQTIRQMSKGQARRVALLCAVASRPEFLVLDEPAGSLDPAARREFLQTTVQLLTETGSTILFSSHQMDDIERMAGRVVLIDDGSVILDRSLDELKEGYCLAQVDPERADRVRQQLISDTHVLAHRLHAGSLRIVLALDKTAGQAHLEQTYSLSAAGLSTLPLEELFIEFVEGQR